MKARKWAAVLRDVAVSTAAAVLATVLLYRSGWGDALEDVVPVHFYKWAISTCSPEVVIDGEMACDVRFFDSLTFYIPLLSACFFGFLRWSPSKE